MGAPLITVTGALDGYVVRMAGEEVARASTFDEAHRAYRHTLELAARAADLLARTLVRA